MLPVPHHGGLHHLPEGRLLRRGHQQSAQLVDPHAVGVEVQFVGALRQKRRYINDNNVNIALNEFL